jgi:hypothetical protein
VTSAGAVRRDSQFAAYRRVGAGYELHTLQIFTVTAEGISRNSVLQDSEVFAAFGLAAGLALGTEGTGLAWVVGVSDGDDAGALRYVAGIVPYKGAFDAVSCQRPRC